MLVNHYQFLSAGMSRTPTIQKCVRRIIQKRCLQNFTGTKYLQKKRFNPPTEEELTNIYKLIHTLRHLCFLKPTTATEKSWRRACAGDPGIPNRTDSDSVQCSVDCSLFVFRVSPAGCVLLSQASASRCTHWTVVHALALPLLELSSIFICSPNWGFSAFARPRDTET